MCYDDQARPPDPPGEKQQARGEDLTLTAADGNRLMAYFARPEGPAEAQLLIYPDVRGLRTFYKELALRFAEAGIAAIAIDYFGRTAGAAARDDSFDHKAHVKLMTLPSVLHDSAAGLDHLRRQNAASATFTLGFCMGGGLALVSGTQDFGLSGLIAFYSGLTREYEGHSVLERTRQIHCPVLALFGGADESIPPAQVQQLERNLEGAGVEHEIHTYPGAPHGFFDRMATDYAAASADAWKRVLAFIAAHAHAVERPG